MFLAGAMVATHRRNNTYADCVFTGGKSKSIVVLPKASIGDVWVGFKGAILALLVPLIIVVGVVGGFFTATESGNDRG